MSALRHVVPVTLLLLPLGCARDAVEPESPESEAYEPMPEPTTTSEPTTLPPEVPPVDPTVPSSDATPGPSGTDKTLDPPGMDVGGRGGMGAMGGSGGTGAVPRGGVGGQRAIGSR